MAELQRLAEGCFTYITSDKWTPKRALEKARNVLGSQLVVLTGERSIGTDMPIEANRSVCFPYQPGLLRAIRDTRPNVMIGDGFFQWTAATLWMRARYGTPHVMCYERTAHTERNASLYRRFYRKVVMRWIDAICCNGSLCGEYTSSLGFPQERITFGHMVADTGGMRNKALCVGANEINAIRNRFGLRGTVFLCVGRLIRSKGIQQLLAGWAQFCRASHGAASLLLVGDGPSRCENELYCRNGNLSDVHFAGTVDYDSLAQYYRSADVFIIPTLEDNWSLVVPEAMSCGLPIICSKYNGCWPELVHESENGWVFDPCSVESCAHVLEMAVNCSRVLPSMGRRSLEIVADHTASHAAEAILQACRIAVNR